MMVYPISTQVNHAIHQPIEISSRRIPTTQVELFCDNRWVHALFRWMSVNKWQCAAVTMLTWPPAWDWSSELLDVEGRELVDIVPSNLFCRSCRLNNQWCGSALLHWVLQQTPLSLKSIKYRCNMGETFTNFWLRNNTYISRLTATRHVVS